MSEPVNASSEQSEGSEARVAKWSAAEQVSGVSGESERRNERPSGPFKTRSSVTRNAPKERSHEGKSVGTRDAILVDVAVRVFDAATLFLPLQR